MTEMRWDFEFGFTQIILLPLDLCWLSRDQKSLIMHDDNQKEVFAGLTRYGFYSPEFTICVEWAYENRHRKTEFPGVIT